MIDHKNEFIDAFNTLARHKGWHSVFDDFLTASVAAIHNACLHDDHLEKSYMELVKRYSKDEFSLMAKMLSHVSGALRQRHQDFLGDVFMSLQMGNSNLGQFFTPYHISALMASLNTGPSFQLPEKGFVTVSEPTCGSGGMIIAMAESIANSGFDPKEVMFVMAVDLSASAFKMAFIQLSLLDIPAEVIHGNSLTLECFKALRTPAYYVGGWHEKLMPWREDQSSEHTPNEATNDGVLPDAELTDKVNNTDFTCELLDDEEGDIAA